MAPQDDVEVAGSNTAEKLALVLAGAVRSPVIVTPQKTASPLDALRLPSIKIKDYARRLEQYCRCTQECYVLSLVYIERALERNPSLVITDLNVHRLLLSATILAAKMQDDDYYSNDYYAKVGGVSTEELISLEAHMLALLDWRAYVSEDDYTSSLKRLNDGQVSLLIPTSKVEATSENRPVVDRICKAVVREESTPKKVALQHQVTTKHEVTTPDKAKPPAVRERPDKVVASKAPATCAQSCPGRGRKRSATPGHLNARRNRVCLAH